MVSIIQQKTSYRLYINGSHIIFDEFEIVPTEDEQFISCTLFGKSVALLPINSAAILHYSKYNPQEEYGLYQSTINDNYFTKKVIDYEDIAGLWKKRSKRIL